jgi:hypothetical protein
VPFNDSPAHGPDGDINIRGFSAAAIGGQFVAHIAFESGEDTQKAMAILKNLD